MRVLDPLSRMNYISQTLQTENLQFVRETLRSSEGVPPKSAVNAKCKYLCNRNKRAIAFLVSWGHTRLTGMGSMHQKSVGWKEKDLNSAPY